jgi:glycosyltransferase involved in cell wall biosynthesis
MRILICHSFYQQFGGEDQSFLDEAALLRSHGHQVVEYTRHNDEIEHSNRVVVAARSVWNRVAYRDLRSLIRRHRPELMHCTNLFPLISPSAYRAAKDEGIPVVQALRNYRLLCPSATLMRNGGVCESCVGKAVPWPAVRHACYRESRMGSAVVAAMLAIHNLKGTWRQVDRFYTPSQFARSLFVRVGMPADRIDVKPNTVIPDPGPGPGDGGYVLFAGRLSPEKGISTLLSAWELLKQDLKLRIIGDGPCRELVENAAAKDSRITYVGRRPLQQVYDALRAATCLVMPSVWYETFGRTIIEAYAAGTPVVASRLGAIDELIDEGRTGLKFTPGDASDLAAAVCRLTGDADRLARMRSAARRLFETRYSAAASYARLIEIYGRALQSRNVAIPNSLRFGDENSLTAPIAAERLVCARVEQEEEVGTR